MTKSNSLSDRFEKANSLLSIGRLDEARALYEQLVKVSTENNRQVQLFEVLINLAVCLQRLGQYSIALNRFLQVLSSDPRHKRALLNRANLFIELYQFQKAKEDLETVISDYPDYAEAHNSLGIVFLKRREFSSAIHHLRTASLLNPNFAEAKANLGVAYRELGLFDESMQCFNDAVKLRPGYLEALWNKGLLHLLLGEFAVGWHLYEVRKLLRSPANVNQKSQGGLGGSSTERAVLIRSEQGYGDVIQFCRFVKKLATRSNKIYLEAPASLVRVLTTLGSGIDVFPVGTPLPPHTFSEDLLSLPLLFNVTLRNIPAHDAYLFAEKSLVASWRKKLGILSNEFRVGISWSGNLEHDDDSKRSIDLILLSRLLRLPVQWHSLQKEYRGDDRRLFLSHHRCFDHHEELTDFSQTAALIECMDLVICVDTAVAHLAGALGKSVWILLPSVPDFRWMLDREDSPWYPSARLIRSAQLGDWGTAITRVERMLVAFTSEKNF